MDLKRKIEELKEKNDSLGLTIQRTRYSVKRIKLEYAMLLERLEQRIDIDPELNYHNVLPTMEVFKEDLMINPLKRSKNNKRYNISTLTTNFNHTTTTTKAKERDPNLPKRPTNAYLIYCEMNKDRLKENGSLDVTKDLSESWKKLNEGDRSPYYNLYVEDKKRYDHEMEIYNSNKLKLLKEKEQRTKEQDEDITDPKPSKNVEEFNEVRDTKEINDSVTSEELDSKGASSNIKEEKDAETEDDIEKSETESNTASDDQKQMT